MEDSNKKMDDTAGRNTEWALLFPLKAGLFAMKSSTKVKVSKSKSSENDRSKMRRGSSLSELDRLTVGKEFVRSTTTNQHLAASPVSLPQSPYLSRSLLSSNTTSLKGSIGDLMNQKKYGSSQWSVRSESLIARTMPLTTVTTRASPRESMLVIPSDFDDEVWELKGPLTTAQRTKKLSRLIERSTEISSTYVTVGLYVVIAENVCIPQMCGLSI